MAVMPQREREEDAAAETRSRGFADKGEDAEECFAWPDHAAWRAFGVTARAETSARMQPDQQRGNTMRLGTTLAAVGLCLAATACNGPQSARS